MDIRGDFVPAQTAVNVHCPWCGQVGVSLWEDGKDGRQLVRLDGFYERLARKEPYPIETVCNACGKVLPRSAAAE